MKNMKRALAVLLTLALALPLCLSGCGEKAAAPLRICVDVGGPNASANFDNLLKTIADYGGPKDVEVEYVPQEGGDRESVIKHLKTELMSGAGPDLFIVETYGGGRTMYNKPMFPIPEQMIERRVFLPLDEYIENAQFAKWDRLTPKVMEAGKGSEGQILVPLAYTLPLSCYRTEDYQHDISPEHTWQEMLDDDSGMLRQAGCFYRMGAGLKDSGVSGIFTGLADYKEEELLFTQEELLEAVEQKLGLTEDDAGELPPCCQCQLSLNLTPTCYSGANAGEVLYPKDPMTIVPQYNREGGITAKVSAFAAINRNSKRPEEAFFVLDYLLGREAMGHSAFYLSLTGESGAMVMDLDMGRGELSFQQYPNMAEENMAQIDKIRESVTSVGFANALDEQIRVAYIDAQNVLFLEGSGLSTCSPGAREEIEDIVREAYRVMDMELKES